VSARSGPDGGKARAFTPWPFLCTYFFGVLTVSVRTIIMPPFSVVSAVSRSPTFDVRVGHLLAVAHHDGVGVEHDEDRLLVARRDLDVRVIHVGNDAGHLLLLPVLGLHGKRGDREHHQDGGNPTLHHRFLVPLNYLARAGRTVTKMAAPGLTRLP
jgi:hypothetical protein